MVDITTDSFGRRFLNFSSVKDLREHYLSLLTPKLEAAARDFEQTHLVDLGKLGKLAEQWVTKHVNESWVECEKKGGKVLESDLHDRIERAVVWTVGEQKDIIRIKTGIDKIHRSLSYSGAIQSSYASPVQKAMEIPRGVLVGGMAIGAAAGIHGTVAAVSSTDRQDGKRNWRKTALHAAEAVVGVLVGWTSYVELAKIRSPGR